MHVQQSMETAPWRKNFKMAWGRGNCGKSNVRVSVIPLELSMRTFDEIYVAGHFRVGEEQNSTVRWTRRVRGMLKMSSPSSCVFVFMLILSSFGASWEEQNRKKGSYSVPLLRTKRDLRDSRGNPTENLKGRPGQGYYIATDLGTPAQRVSRTIIYCSQCLPCVAHKHPFLQTLFYSSSTLLPSYTCLNTTQNESIRTGFIPNWHQLLA